MSLRKMCRELVLESLLGRKDTGGDQGRMQLILDEVTQRVINAFLKMTDLMEAGIVSIELINRQREPIPDLDALYLLRPDADSLDCVLEDFRLQAKPQHNKIHLAFTRFVVAEQLDRLAAGPNLPPRVSSIVEVPLSFIAIQDRGFHFDMPQCIPFLFPKPIAVKGPELIGEIGASLADVFRCLQTTGPTIYHASSQICKLVAERLQQDLALHKRPRGKNQGAEVPCQLLIVDRSVDMAATLVHDYHYEACAYDLLDGPVLDVDRHIVSMNPMRAQVEPVRKMTARASISWGNGGSAKHPEDEDVPAVKKGREALLSENDRVWEALKHYHFSSAQEEVQKQVSEVAMAAEQSAQVDMNVSDLLAQLRKTPEHKEIMEKLDLHTFLLTTINEKMVETKIVDGLGGLEQDIACGVDKIATEIKPNKLQDQFTKFMSRQESQLPGETKLRLLMLYLVCMANVPEQMRDKLIECCNLQPDDNLVLRAMMQSKLMEVPEALNEMLGTGMAHRGSKTKQVKRFKANAKIEGRFELSRFDPKVKELLEQLGAGQLDKEEFTRLTEESADKDVAPNASGASLRAAAGGGAGPAAPAFDDWSFAEPVAPAAGNPFAAPKETAEVCTQRLVIFIIGGLTYSELRVASEVQKELPAGTEILMGGTSILTPKRLIEILRPQKEADKEGNPFGGDGDAADLT